LSPCLNSCATGNATCTVRLSGRAVQIASVGFISERMGGGPCTAICGPLVARCETPPLPAGSYEITYNSDKRELAVPSEPAVERGVCVGHRD
jgi:hypothetical protein